MKRNKILENTIVVLLALIACVPVIAPDLPFLQWGVDYSVQLMLGFLVLGLGFLLLGKKRLLFTSFACCGMLCLFLKQSSNSNLRLPEINKEEKLTIAHFNTSSATDGYESILNAVLKSGADIVSFQEVTPDWNLFLSKSLRDIYPYTSSNVRIDPYGMAIFSKVEINTVDTFHFENIPHQMINIPVSDNRDINIVSAHVLPPLGQRLNEKATKYLETIASKISIKESPSIVLGDFNMVYWSNEIRSFTDQADLENSRRDVSANLLSIPYDHIFYTSDLECTEFRDINDTTSNHLGILGTYQFKSLPIQKSEVPSIFTKG